MPQPTFYIDLFTPQTWREAGDRGYTVTGFSERRLGYAKRIQSGDIFLCYLTGKSKFIGALRATSEVFTDTTPIWESRVFPTRFRCELMVEVPVEQGVGLREVQQRSATPKVYDWIFRASPHKMPEDDATWILERLEQIASGSTPPPRERQPEVALDPPELVPIQPEGVSPKPTPLTLQDDVAAVAAGTERAHTRIQWMLAKLAQDLGLRAWIARNDKNAVYEGQRLGDLSIDELPFRHERTYQGTIERIDVLWLRGHAIEGAFEIESTTAIYSGLLRMADLLALQPNLNIPLFIVAPDDRREHVLREIRRPTFTRLDPPLHSVCRYIAFSKLEQLTETHGDTLRYMRPDIIDSIAEEAR